MQNKETTVNNSVEQNIPARNGSYSNTDRLSATEQLAIPAANWTERLLSDPIFRFIWKWRSQSLALALVILLGVFYYHNSQEAFINSMNDAARVLVEGRKELAEYDRLVKERQVLLVEKTDQKKLEEVDEKIKKTLETANAKFNVLVNSSGIYQSIGNAYQVIMASKQGQLQQALSSIDKLQYQDRKISDDQRLYYELAWLYVARATLDDDKLRTKGFTILNELADKGNYSAVPAAITIANLAESEQELKNARTLLEKLLARFPEKAEMLEEALESL